MNALHLFVMTGLVILGLALAPKPAQARVRDSRAIEDLHPDVIPFAREWLSDSEAEGHRVRVWGTTRSRETQASKVEQGLSTVEVSWHESGHAIDWIAAVPKAEEEGGGFYDFAVYEVGDPLYKRWLKAQTAVAEIAKRHGFAWGGDWRRFKDRYHIERPPAGVSMADARDAFEELLSQVA